MTNARIDQAVLIAGIGSDNEPRLLLVNDDGSIAGGGSGTVTSVGLTAPSIFTVTGSPVTGAGALDFALNTQAQNLVFAGPSSGVDATPTFRILDNLDLPSPLIITSAGVLQWGSSGIATPDITIRRSGAQSLIFGAADSATPLGFTITGGESARGGVDTNIPCGTLTIQGGLGTGNATNLIGMVFRVARPTTSGTGQQTYTNATAMFLGTSPLQANYLALGLSDANIVVGYILGQARIILSAPFEFAWSSTNGGIDTLDSTKDTYLSRGGDPQTIIIGRITNGAPVTHTLVVGSQLPSSAGIANSAGSNGIIQSGKGTGTGAPSTLSLASPIAGVSGTTRQSAVTGLVIKIGTAVLTSYTVANLPAAATAGVGATAFVTDANTTTTLGIGLTVVGGGANKVPVYSDGTNWIIG